MFQTFTAVESIFRGIFHAFAFLSLLCTSTGIHFLKTRLNRAPVFALGDNGVTSQVDSATNLMMTERHVNGTENVFDN